MGYIKKWVGFLTWCSKLSRKKKRLTKTRMLTTKCSSCWIWDDWGRICDKMRACCFCYEIEEEWEEK
jgi:hypothetical protein